MVETKVWEPQIKSSMPIWYSAAAYLVSCSSNNNNGKETTEPQSYGSSNSFIV